MLGEEVKADEEVVLAAVCDERNGVRLPYSVELEVQCYPIGDFSCVVASDRYRVRKPSDSCSAILDCFEGFLRITKDVSICSSAS